MNNDRAAPPAAIDGDGVAQTGRPGSHGRRRARNRRYRRNRARRSLLTIMAWNAEGLRPKIAELSSWLSEARVDVVAVQEGQFPKTAPRLPGFQPPVVTRRTRGRRSGGPVKGGDVAIYVRDGRHFTVLSGPFKPSEDDTTEICGVRLLGSPDIDFINIYRPPVRSDESDDRQDNFNPDYLPCRDNTIIAGDINAHHPLWDTSCDGPDDVGERIAAWLDNVGWTTLNDGRPTFTSYRSGGQTAPDAAFCSSTLAQRIKWSVGPDFGSDHVPMIMEVRTGGTAPKMIRKPRWSFKKAAWLAFHDECEAAFEEAGPEHESAQELATRFHQVLYQASVHHIPRGARARTKPWALDPELEEAIEDRRAARRDMRSGDPSTKERWLEAKRRAASVERRVSQKQFREFVSNTLNKHQSLGRVHKTLKMWEGASDDQHRAGETIVDNGRTLVTDREKATAFNRTYATVSKQVRNKKVDRDAKARLKEIDVRTCRECDGEKNGYCSPFTEEELVPRPRRPVQRTYQAPRPESAPGSSQPHQPLVADRSRPAGVAPRRYRPHPQVGEGPEADRQLPAHRSDVTRREAGRAGHRHQTVPPGRGAPHHPT